ncbi:insulinase family protein [Streptomyces roseoverticillatus]|uniref:M16 family metallopeptidase n=1 Tax=Streptomyces roseoverticillatus TaxID=66429 RepID=UPI001F34334D|nr:insulinase family protein [Streptomyces roseoverticillatus]MCF3106791.1 insulinase family protein [Streptomyces roseoverticillatus]
MSAPTVSARPLTDGPQLVAVDRPGARLAAVRLDVRVGSADERPGERGLAHVVEHLVVRCLLAGGRVGDGALADARTGRERTGYSVLVRRADAPAALDALTAAFGELRVPPAVLAAELAAIRRETAQRAADVRRQLQEALLAALWDGTSYAHSPLGDAAVLDALTEDDVRRFHARWYCPSRATAVLAADRASGELAALAERWAGRTVADGEPAVSAGRDARPAVRSAYRELPATASAGAGRAAGLAFAVAAADGDGPYARDCRDLARRAVRAAGGVDLRWLELRGYVCVWAVFRAPDAASATRVARTALRAARERLLTADGAAWLRAEALIPHLRAAEDLETTAARATDGGAEPPASVSPSDVAAVIALWERQTARIDDAGDAS